MLLRRALFLLSILAFLTANAQSNELVSKNPSYALRIEKKSIRNFLSISGESTQIKIEDGQVTGAGIRADFNHSFASSFSAEIYFSSAIQSSGASSFTGMGTYIFYHPFSPPTQGENRILLNNSTVLLERVPSKQRFQIGVGLNQMFLNGTTGVYSLSGPGFQANYIFDLFRFTWKLGAQTSSLKTGSESATATSFNLGISIPL